MKSKFRLFFPCYFSFFVNGAMVLLVGAILPYIIEEAGINYSVAGGFFVAVRFSLQQKRPAAGNELLPMLVGRAHQHGNAA